MGSIAQSIHEFCTAKVGEDVTAREMYDHIVSRGLSCSPESVSRTFRKLHQQGAVVYGLINRGKSIYHIHAVA